MPLFLQNGIINHARFAWTHRGPQPNRHTTHAEVSSTTINPRMWTIVTKRIWKKLNSRSPLLDALSSVTGMVESAHPSCTTLGRRSVVCCCTPTQKLKRILEKIPTGSSLAIGKYNGCTTAAKIVRRPCPNITSNMTFKLTYSMLLRVILLMLLCLGNTFSCAVILLIEDNMRSIFLGYGLWRNEK